MRDRQLMDARPAETTLLGDEDIVSERELLHRKCEISRTGSAVAELEVSTPPASGIQGACVATSA